MLTYFYVEGNYFSKQNKLVKKEQHCFTLLQVFVNVC